jgi:hypothetical protein
MQADQQLESPLVHTTRPLLGNVAKRLESLVILVQGSQDRMITLSFAN